MDETREDPVIEALATIPSIDQEILTLTSWDGLKPHEIATVLGLSPNVVRVRLHRARARLRKALSAQADEAPAAPTRAPSNLVQHAAPADHGK